MLHKIKKLIRKRSNINLIIKAIAVVMVRRGVRGILDKVLFPDNPMISYITSIFLGITILLIDNDKLDELSHH